MRRTSTTTAGFESKINQETKNVVKKPGMVLSLQPSKKTSILQAQRIEFWQQKGMQLCSDLDFSPAKPVLDF